MNVLFAVLFYVATLILVGGVAYKVYDFARTPAPLKIPTTPAPTTATTMAIFLIIRFPLLCHVGGGF